MTRQEWRTMLRGQAVKMNGLEAGPAMGSAQLYFATYGNSDARGLPWNFDSLHHHHYQPHCSKCFAQVGLKPCPVCHCVMFCADCESTYTEEHTPVKCELHCVRLAAVVMAYQFGSYLKSATSSRSAERANRGDLLPPDWASFFRAKMGEYLPHVPRELLAMPAVAGQLTDTMSGIFTVIHTLQKVYAAEDARASRSGSSPAPPSSRSRIVLHVLGAEVNDQLGATAFEEVLHFFPECTSLDVVMCGPGLRTGPPFHTSDQAISKHLCKGCKKKCSVRCTIVQTTYHEAIMSEAIPSSLRRPTIAIAMNSGLHERESGLLHSWEPTIKFLYENNVPTIFTSYTKDEVEADQEQIFSVVRDSDLAIAATMGLTIDEKDLEKGVFMVPGTLNPFRSLLPMPDTFEDNEFFFNNMFYLVLYKSP